MTGERTREIEPGIGPAVDPLSGPDVDAGIGLGIGLAAVARPAYITSGRAADLGGQRSVADLARRTAAVLDAAYAAGVRYVDVARSYGRAEEFLAAWRAAHPQVDDLVVGSKWGYRYVGDWRLDAAVHEVKDHSLAAFTAQLAETEATLGLPAIYHVHSATLDTGALSDAPLHRALARLRERGVRVGISTSGPAQADAVRRAMEVSVDGAALFTSFQSTWNLLEPSVGPALAEAHGAGALVIVKEPVANGRLAPGGSERPDDAGARAAAEYAAGLGAPVDQVAIAAALAQPWSWRVLSGAVDAAQVASNAAAAGLTVAADALAELAEDPAAYWSARSARAWT